MLSEAQKEHEMVSEESGGGGEGGRGCGRSCLSKCCLRQGAKLLLYCFSKIDEDLCLPVPKVQPRVSFLDRLLEEWDDRKVRGLFHHDIAACETKVLPGKHNFIIVLIEGRDLKKRPTEFRIDEVLQPFDGDKFNFTKIGQEELIFRFEESSNGKAGYFQSAPIMSSSSPNIIAINVSPIAHGHVLLIPRILDFLPQRIDCQSFLLAMYMVKAARNPYFRMGYNSLGAFATINHLHFQGYYLEVKFPVEKAPTQIIATVGSGVNVAELLEYPVRGLVFEGGKNMLDLSDTVSSACIFLQESNRPFNVLFSECGKRIFLLLQCYAMKQAHGKVSPEILETRVNPACWELGGHFALKRRKDFDEASEEGICKFLAQVALSEQEFQLVKESILKSLSGGPAGKKNTGEML
ncbi:GDP-L-galactose phosphorylase 1-like isoform X1 [Ananas comosus]|uniref:GDP-L-galactose phosphorylase 1 n=1 Tax=Ananas comosus TaxID=4615 RepID=A0A199W043_ANACO|nr:GDP-L-galactose phosphorylase 1-like isoform X1 [Ananas comosus]XP_020097948.1 GDP-L-galactose phosphorylase 1-like isoform X1 [Ananas comosus]OAY82608.1 GDP-L-galactose phosphorylase 1 [Ananas comosus]